MSFFAAVQIIISVAGNRFHAVSYPKIRILKKMVCFVCRASTLHQNNVDIYPAPGEPWPNELGTSNIPQKKGNYSCSSSSSKK